MQQNSNKTALKVPASDTMMLYKTQLANRATNSLVISWQFTLVLNTRNGTLTGSLHII